MKKILCVEVIIEKIFLEVSLLMACSFDLDKQNVEEFMKLIECGKVQLPDFQREWVWTNELICNLISSIICSYPISVIMLLECQTAEP